jgi:hypothetical protein
LERGKVYPPGSFPRSPYELKPLHAKKTQGTRRTQKSMVTLKKRAVKNLDASHARSMVK